MRLKIKCKSRENNFFLLWGEGRNHVCARTRRRQGRHTRERQVGVYEEIGQEKKETASPREEGEKDNNTSYVLI